MKQRLRTWATLTAIAVVLGCTTSAEAQTEAPAPPRVEKGSAVTRHATGTFEVTSRPQGPPDQAEGIAVGRVSVDKRFHGDLEGTSKVEMLTAAADSTGAGAYVAIERVTGTVHGRRGSFIVMHSGTRTRDGQQLTVTVAPGLGTGQLVGLAGAMTITIVDKKHLYDLEYTLPTTP